MIRWIALLVAAALVLMPLAVAETAKPDANTAAPKITAAEFAKKALQSGEKEVAMAELAAAKSQNTGVKQFAEMIVADHTRVNEQLRLLVKQNAERNAAASVDAPPPTAPGAAPSPEHKQIDGLTGTAFDKAFMAMMVDGHSKSVELYEQAAQFLPAGPAKKLAEDTLPKIKQHFEQAKSLNTEVAR